MDQLTIITNNVPRDVIEGYEVPNKYHDEFNYIDWDKIETGEASATFFRYKGQLYDLSEFESIGPYSPLLGKWSLYQPDSFFSGIAIRWVDDQFEQVVVARFYY